MAYLFSLKREKSGNGNRRRIERILRTRNVINYSDTDSVLNNSTNLLDSPQGQSFEPKINARYLALFGQVSYRHTNDEFFQSIEIIFSSPMYPMEAPVAYVRIPTECKATIEINYPNPNVERETGKINCEYLQSWDPKMERPLVGLVECLTQIFSLIPPCRSKLLLPPPTPLPNHGIPLQTITNESETIHAVAVPCTPESTSVCSDEELEEKMNQNHVQVYYGLGTSQQEHFQQFSVEGKTYQLQYVSAPNPSAPVEFPTQPLHVAGNVQVGADGTGCMENPICSEGLTTLMTNQAHFAPPDKISRSTLNSCINANNESCIAVPTEQQSQRYQTEAGHCIETKSVNGSKKVSFSTLRAPETQNSVVTLPLSLSLPQTTMETCENAKQECDDGYDSFMQQRPRALSQPDQGMQMQRTFGILHPLDKVHRSTSNPLPDQHTLQKIGELPYVPPSQTHSTTMPVTSQSPEQMSQQPNVMLDSYSGNQASTPSPLATPIVYARGTESHSVPQICGASITLSQPDKGVLGQNSFGSLQQLENLHRRSISNPLPDPPGIRKELPPLRPQTRSMPLGISSQAQEDMNQESTDMIASYSADQFPPALVSPVTYPQGTFSQAVPDVLSSRGLSQLEQGSQLRQTFRVIRPLGRTNRSSSSPLPEQYSQGTVNEVHSLHSRTHSATLAIPSPPKLDVMQHNFEARTKPSATLGYQPPSLSSLLPLPVPLLPIVLSRQDISSPVVPSVCITPTPPIASTNSSRKLDLDFMDRKLRCCAKVQSMINTVILSRSNSQPEDVQRAKQLLHLKEAIEFQLNAYRLKKDRLRHCVDRTERCCESILPDGGVLHKNCVVPCSTWDADMIALVAEQYALNDAQRVLDIALSKGIITCLDHSNHCGKIEERQICIRAIIYGHICDMFMTTSR